MKVRLLKEVVDAGATKTVVRRSRQSAIAFFPGVVVEMSDASAQKYIDNGLAEAFVEPTADESTEALS